MEYMKWVKKCLPLTVLSIFSLSCTSQHLSPIPLLSPPPLPPPSSPVTTSTAPPGRVVVLTATQSRDMDAVPGGIRGYSADDVAAEVITAELMGRGYRVVDRQALKAIFREQGFQQSGVVDQATAVKLGKFAGAGAIVIANVYNVGTSQHQGFQGGTGNALVDMAGKFINPSGAIHRVDMSVKMLSTESAEVIWLQDKSLQSAPGQEIPHIQLLKNLVSTLAFPSPSTDVIAEEPKAVPPPKTKTKKSSKKAASSPPAPSPPRVIY